MDGAGELSRDARIEAAARAAAAAAPTAFVPPPAPPRDGRKTVSRQEAKRRSGESVLRALARGAALGLLLGTAVEIAFWAFRIYDLRASGVEPYEQGYWWPASFESLTPFFTYCIVLGVVVVFGARYTERDAPSSHGSGSTARTLLGIVASALATGGIAGGLAWLTLDLCGAARGTFTSPGLSRELCLRAGFQAAGAATLLALLERPFLRRRPSVARDLVAFALGLAATAVGGLLGGLQLTYIEAAIEGHSFPNVLATTAEALQPDAPSGGVFHSLYFAFALSLMGRLRGWRLPARSALVVLGASLGMLLEPALSFIFFKGTPTLVVRSGGSMGLMMVLPILRWVELTAFAIPFGVALGSWVGDLVRVPFRRRETPAPADGAYAAAAREVSPAAEGADSTAVTTPSPGPAGAPGAPLPGRVGEHEVLSEIARGGMGVVYRARHAKLGREVALKMLTSPLASTSELERFRFEAAAASSLDHPGIVPVYEFGEHEGRPWLSMKLVAGGTLKDRLPRLARDPRACVALLSLVARAMHHAHRRGVLHRDLKPANILVDAGGAPLVSDFGLAKQVGSDAQLTQTGAVVGTPSYMAPEQARGTRALTTAVDVYSIGAILYEALVGRPPFVGATPLATVLAVLEKDVVAPRALVPDVDQDLETISLRCLEREPERRYRSAEELADELERWLRGEPILARPLGARDRLVRWARRRPAAAGLVVVTALAVVLGVTGFAWSYRALAARQRETETALAAQAKAVYRSRIALAQARSALGDMVGAAAVLESCRPTASPRETAWPFEWHLLERRVHGEYGRLTAQRMGNVAFSPDSTRIAVLGGNGSLDRAAVTVIDAATGATELRFAAAEWKIVEWPDTAPPESASASGWRLVSGTHRAAVGLDAGAVAWSPDGARLAVGLGHRRNEWEPPGRPYDSLEVVAYDVSGGEARVVWRHRTEPMSGGATSLVYSPDGRWLAWLADTPSATDDHRARTTLFVLDAATGSLVQALGPFAVFPWPEPAWSRDGDRLVACGQLWDTRTWTPVALPAGYVEAQALSPDGRTACLASTKFGVGFLVDLATGAPRENKLASGRSFAWSPDGARIAAGTDAARVWDAATGELLLDLGVGAGQVTFSPDGRSLAVVGAEEGGVSNGRGALRLFAVETRGAARKGPDDSRRPFAAQRVPEGLRADAHDSGLDVTWSPDGRRLLVYGFRGYFGAGGCTVRLLDAASGDALLERPASHAAFSPALREGSLLAVAEPASIELYASETGARVRSIAVVGSPSLVAFGKTGRLLVAEVDRDGRREVEVFRTDDGSRVQAPSGWGIPDLSGESRGHFRWVIDPEGARFTSLAATGTTNERPSVEAWPSGTWIGIKRDWRRPAISTGEPVLGVELSLDGSLVAARSASGRVRVFETETRIERAAPEGLEPFVGDELGPCGRRLDLKARYMDVGGDFHLAAVGNPLGGCGRSISPDGRHYVTVGNGGGQSSLAVLEVPGPKVTRALRPQEALSACWSPDGERLLTVGKDGIVRLWDWRAGEEILAWPAGEGTRALELSPDGMRLAALRQDGVLLVLDGSPHVPWSASLPPSE